MPLYSRSQPSIVIMRRMEPGPAATVSRLRKARQLIRQPQYLVASIVGLLVLSVTVGALAMYSAHTNKYNSAAKIVTHSGSSQIPGTSPANLTTKSTPQATGSVTTGAQSSTNGSTTGPSGSGNSGGGSAAPNSPAGKVFALLDPGESNSNMQTYAAKSSVDGLAYRAVWKSLEPTAGNYNWSSVDNALVAASANNKKVTIHVGASGGAWPSWLPGLGAQTYSYSSPQGNVTDPIPWDAVYIQRYNQFVAALGQHISVNGKLSVIQAVSADAPVSEMTIVGCANGFLSGGVTYNRTSYLNAWKSTIAANAAAYPGKPILVSLPISFICQNDGNDGKSFMTQLMTAAGAAAPVSYYAADLNAVGSARSAQADASLKSSHGINYQTIWSSTNDTQNRLQGSLSSAVCYGWNAGSRYFEIYKADLSSSDPGTVSAIARARTGSGC